MKNRSYKLIAFVLLFVSVLVLNGCSNPSYGVNAGVDVNWGSHGPEVRPHVSFDVYNGGRF